ncbi:hypothetical protein [Gloeobacter violaceus]|uniref:Gll0553 protein n=1 Tax=Gloeobacter violaceus (strain ATCC 29082 / PCC 7421) TaxID=251221 RepID=Q7NN61_GLOVI|nr:hypothetical protein [Gloeobacter violaceus]BAC88494.1 gll0553 [Gloeobacter violaceus PCC 7421]
MAAIRPMCFDGTFELDPEAKQTLFTLLHGEAFRGQIRRAADCASVAFTELVFQPVPYSFETPHGMARAFEPYFHSSDYVLINVPPNFMFKARISNPSRLCAIYRKGNGKMPGAPPPDDPTSGPGRTE